MKKILVLTLLVFFVLSAMALAQDDKFVTAANDTKIKRIEFKEPPPSLWYVPNEMIVQLKTDAEETTDLAIRSTEDNVLTGNSELDDLNKKYGVTRFVREFPDAGERAARSAQDLAGYYCVKFSEKFRLKEVLEAYKEATVVSNTEPIGIHPIYERIPNDTYFAGYQWNLKDPEDNDIDATDAWELDTGDASVVVAILDSGIQYNSKDLGDAAPWTTGNMWINDAEYGGTPGVDDDGNGFVDDWVGWDFVDNVSGVWPGEDGDTPDNEPTDFNGHGTHCAGIAAAITNNNYGVAGVTGGWGLPGNGIKVMACRIGYSAPHPIYGYEVGYVRMDFAAQAMYYATNNGACAINCSWGSSNSGGLGAAVTYAINNGVIVCHAAGNDGSQTADYLGSRTDVINVCATNDNDQKPYWSTYGSWVDISAPGEDIASTYSDHYTPDVFVQMSGTSMSTPHVTSAVGMLESYVPGLSWSEKTDLILNHTDDIDDLNPSYAGLMGSGRLNVFRMLDAAIAPAVTVIQPNGGEVLYIGQEYDIMWDATDNVGIDSTLVDYSVDSGVEWTRIATLTGNPGVFTWTVTGPPSDQCRVRVTCYDGEGMAGDDMSDEDFCPPYKMAPRHVSIIEAGTVPTEYALLQNYPNPFNARTNIRFALRDDCHVTVDIFNMLGQKVATIVDEDMAAGYHTAKWNAVDAASGMYLYRLTAGNFVDTRKLVLMK